MGHPGSVPDRKEQNATADPSLPIPSNDDDEAARREPRFAQNDNFADGLAAEDFIALDAFGGVSGVDY